MGIIGSAVGAGLSAIGSIWGGLSASKAMKKVKSNLEDQQNKNQAWYDRRYNEDATQRADAQRIWTRTQELMRNRNQQAAGVQAVMGGTEESVAATKAANAQAMADAASKIAVANGSRKDMIESQYQARDAQLNSELNDMEMQRAKNTAQAVQGVAQAASNMGSAF